MNYFFPNSKTAVVQLPNIKYSGSITQVDKLADEIGQYGNIMNYIIQKQGNTTSVIFSLAKNHREFNSKK